MSGIAHQSAFPGSQEDSWDIYHVGHEEESGVDLPCSSTEMNSPKLGLNQAYSCVLESLQSCPFASHFKKMCALKKMMQTRHCISCNYLPKHFFGVDIALQQEECRKLPWFSKPWFQGIGHLKPSHSLELSGISSSAPPRLKFNLIKLVLDKRSRWALCTSTMGEREQGGCTENPGDGEQLRPGWPLPPSACNSSFFQGWGVGSPWVGWCSLDQELSNRWGRSTLPTVQ